MIKNHRIVLNSLRLYPVVMVQDNNTLSEAKKVSVILGLDEHGKPAMSYKYPILLLKSFEDVLKPSLKGNYTYRVDANTPVSENSLNLWRQRGFEPSTIGVAVVNFEGNSKIWNYPAYFWSE